MQASNNGKDVLLDRWMDPNVRPALPSLSIVQGWHTPLVLDGEDIAEQIAIVQGFGYVGGFYINEGATSLRDVAKLSREAVLSGRCPLYLPTHISGVQKLVDNATRLARRLLHLDEGQGLFEVRGKGHSFSRLNQAGLEFYYRSRICIVRLD